jgi:acetolactate synthase small subunit
MLTFVVHTRRIPGALACIVLLFRRCRVQVDSLTAERIGESDVLRIEIKVESVERKARRIEASLYDLGDVLLVERLASARPIRQAAENGRC